LPAVTEGIFDMRIPALSLATLLIFSGDVFAADESCRETAGLKYAQKLEQQCFNSSARNPPCSAAYASCDTMLRYIRKMCQNTARYRGEREPLPVDTKLRKDPENSYCLDFLDIASDFAPSFDCAKAQSATEKAICISRELSQLDVNLAAAYKSARATESISEAEQRVWLKQRDAQCGAGGPACAELIRAHVADLEQREKGNSPSLAVRELTYVDLIGRWEVSALRYFYEGREITDGNDPKNDDPSYMGNVYEFAPQSMTPSDKAAAPEARLACPDNLRMTPVAADDKYNYYKVQGAYFVQCGDGADGKKYLIKAISADTVRLYFYRTILTLKRVTN